MIWLADTVLVLHALIVLFIVGGLIAIWAGAGSKRDWVRNRAIRITHLVAIGVVATLAVLDVPCPLTVLEDYLRSGGAGQPIVHVATCDRGIVASLSTRNSSCTI